MNLRRFKFYRVYLDALSLSNVGDFSWSWILKDFIQEWCACKALVLGV